MDSERCPSPNCYDDVTFHSKRNLAHVIKLRILGWGDAGLSGWAQCNHKGG